MKTPFILVRSYPASKRVLSSQRGVALIISLIMLTLMTLVGMAGIRMITAQERMVGQSLDRTMAFQASESTLREIEARIEAVGRPQPAPSTPCTLTGTAPNQLMICGTTTSATPRWLDPAFAGWTSATEVGSGSFAITPKYFVEYLGNTFPCTLDSAVNATCIRYRITSRANPDDSGDRATVVLQSVYATFNP